MEDKYFEAYVRIKAVRDYVNNSNYADKDIILAILGLKEEEKDGV